MTLTKQVSLRNGREPLQIPIPANFAGSRVNPDQRCIHLLPGVFSILTEDEILVVESFLKTLPYPQSLVFGATLVGADPMLHASHEEIDRLEASNQLPSSRKAPGGGTRSVAERVFIIREAGVRGSGVPALPHS